MRTFCSVILLIAAAMSGCVEAPAHSTTTQAIVECNRATLGQPCDTDNEACTQELCQLVDGEPACSGMGDATDGTVCSSDGDECTIDTCRAGVCAHDEAPWCEVDAGLGADGGADIGDGGADVGDDGGADVGGDAGASDEHDGGLQRDAGPTDSTAFAGDVGGGGLGCSTSSPGAGAILIVLLVLTRRRALVTLALVALPVAARAQVDASVYRPASPASGGFTAESARPLPAGTFDLGFWLDVARDVLVVRDPDTGEVMDHGELIGVRTTSHVTANVGLPHGIELGAHLPIVVDQVGDLRLVGGGAPPEQAVGDLSVGAKVSLLTGRVRVSTAASAELPLGSPATFTHDTGPGFEARLLAGTTLGSTELALAAGRRWRERAMLGNLVVDDEWLAEAGTRTEVIPRRAWLVVDGYLAVSTASVDERRVPAELLAGVRARVAGPWVAQAGMGVGLTHGYGTPSVRGLAMIAWSPERERRPRLREVAVPVIAVAPPPKDADVLVDRDASCADEPASRGCEAPPPPVIEPAPPELVIERIVLDERVLFDTARARVKRSGRKVLARVVAEWATHPEWDRIVIEGHTDERGGDDYNQWLGHERATRVRNALVDLGADSDRLEVVSYGKTRPRGVADEYNRRVELVVLRERGTDPTPAP